MQLHGKCTVFNTEKSDRKKLSNVKGCELKIAGGNRLFENGAIRRVFGLRGEKETGR
jgi:hypothetical protein